MAKYAMTSLPRLGHDNDRGLAPSVNAFFKIGKTSLTELPCTFDLDKSRPKILCQSMRGCYPRIAASML